MITPGTYKHYKGGKYQVLYIAKGQFKDGHDMEDMVVYKALKENSVSQYWVRPLKDFTELIEFEGEQVTRFTFIGE